MGLGLLGLFFVFFVFCMPASIVTGCGGIMDILDEKVKGPHDFLCLYTVCQLWAWGLAETVTGAVQNAHLSL